MRKAVAELGVLAGLVLAVLFVYQPFSSELTFDLLLLTAGGLSLMLLVDSARRAAPRTGRSAFEAALRAGPPGDLPPSQLATTERRVELGIARAADLHFHLCPMLREIAAARLASRHGFDIDIPQGRIVLGEETWELVRGDRSPPEIRFAPGIPLTELASVLDRLESL
jgi:hypothetical protein